MPEMVRVVLTCTITMRRALFGVLLSAGAATTAAAALLCGLAAAAAGLAGALPAWSAVLICIGTPAAAVALAGRATPRASVTTLAAPPLEAGYAD